MKKILFKNVLLVAAILGGLLLSACSVTVENIPAVPKVDLPLENKTDVLVPEQGGNILPQDPNMPSYVVEIPIADTPENSTTPSGTSDTKKPSNTTKAPIKVPVKAPVVELPKPPAVEPPVEAPETPKEPIIPPVVELPKPPVVDPPVEAPETPKEPIVPPVADPPVATEDTTITITAGGKTFTALLENNETARAFAKRLPLTISMEELNGNEKFYNFPQGLPTNSKSVGSISSGDLMLYGADCLVLFYESFSTSYRYTRLGKIGNTNGLAAALGSGSLAVTFSVSS